MNLRSIFWGCAFTWVILALLAPCSASAEQVYPDVRGRVAMSDSAYIQWNGWQCVTKIACWSSLGNSPNVVAGTNTMAVNCYGDIRGELAMWAVIGGITISNDILPIGSYYRIGLQILKQAYGCTPGFNCSDPLFECGVEYHIGNLAGFRSGSAFYWIDLAAAGGTGTGFPFLFRFFNHFFCLGVGCNVVGSSAYAATLHTPAPVDAHVFSPGAGSYAFPSGMSLNFHASPGGTVTATTLASNPPVPFNYPNAVIVPKYWELRTDMTPGSYTVDLGITYSPGDTSMIGGHPTSVFKFEESIQAWQLLSPTTSDKVGHTVTIAGLDRLSVFVIGIIPVSVEGNTWGKIKSMYH